MSNLIPFEFNGTSVRVIEKDGEPWFIAKDVAELLGYTNPLKAVRDHCKGVNEMFTPSAGGTQMMKVIREGDVYRLIMRSKLPAAEQFEEWVVGTVLPSIRKTGSYGVQTVFNPEQLSRLDILQIAMKAEQEKIQLESEKKQLEHKIEEDAPKVAAYEWIEASDDLLTVKQVAQLLGTGRNKFMSFLRLSRWVNRNNEPYQYIVDQGLMDVSISKPFDHPDLGLTSSVTARITGKGLNKLQAMWAEHLATLSEAAKKCSSFQSPKGGQMSLGVQL